MTDVVLGALVRDGRVLLAHRGPGKHAFPDTWDLPGGLVEPGESELDALARELREELGVEIGRPSVRPLCRLTAPVADGPVTFSAWIVGDWEGTPSNAAPEEHVDVRWFPVEELPPLAHAQVCAAIVAAVRPRTG